MSTSELLFYRIGDGRITGCQAQNPRSTVRTRHLGFRVRIRAGAAAEKCRRYFVAGASKWPTSSWEFSWHNSWQVTVQEFEEARTTGKLRLIYIRDKKQRARRGFRGISSYGYMISLKGVPDDYFDDAGQTQPSDWRRRHVTAGSPQSASLTGAEISAELRFHRRLVKLQREIARLQAASTKSLPRGTAVAVARPASSARLVCGSLATVSSGSPLFRRPF